MKKYTLILLLLIAGLTTQAQTKEAVVKITGEVTNPLTIGPAELQQYKQTSVTRKDKDGKAHIYSGVIVSEILTKAGVTLGADLHGKNLVKYLLVEASDGYQVLFALAELDKGFTDRVIILADKIDGQPLAPADGPFRIIVQDEKKPARCIKQVIAMKVMFAK
ncbi:molybdopterin-dependent oxidoreductase [Mucilaginibacter rubeus]|uniref:Molybdopterin-dependent oxidoreductase n=1 Tax=Mucilaginibacter rubeus TaxID=2027860 RepID=A0AAE6JLF7_9SPHI|nr:MULTISPECIES: molybdopterin-dependent oxidoreductase [Mucilaginibacter]QEM07613.1 molybdopterin-dependent oxidoreductase [Mucilaginibacter rubeus]QEM20067.1 molybdopterin-dependent oxidoreductase [Mucilaginibacter gossypii]QTE43222.1 molybdopterin-dependent oxidoreductase [Mucilaginibacter rubeus]QTE49822.1 molybdopterin-dependent oxidoreductase [Mucilaginibacter rubeus]QTE54914.1 molybdopterin-dependent oxidoreductase [Mucilaginibacter rubeus]